MTRQKFYPGERQAEAIKAIKQATYNAVRAYEELRAALDDMGRALQIVQNTDDSPDLVKIRNRIERLRELRNSMELGSFEIAVGHALEEAYRRLP